MDGGDPRYDVYRNSDPELLLEATSRIGHTTERSVSDNPPSGELHFYRVQQRGTCYLAISDATVDSTAPASNFGGFPALRVGDQSGDQRSYLRFSTDPFPADALVRSATLELPYAGGASSQVLTELHAAAATWQADTLTYNDQPGLGSQVSSNSSAPEGTWRRLTMTDLLQGWLDGTQPNHGVVIVADQQNVTDVEFHSTDAAVADRPRLCVDWVEPQVEGLERLAGNIKSVEFDEEGRVTFLTGSFPIDSPVSDDPVILALQFLTDNALLYGIGDPQAELFLDRYSADGAYNTVVFGQRHPEANVPYFASNIVVLLEKGQPLVRVTVGRFERDAPEFTTPLVSLQEAAEIGREHLGQDAYIRGEVVLNQFSSDLLLNDGGAPRLRWRMIVAREDSSAETFEERELFIDAVTGDVVLEMDLGEDLHNGSMDLSIRGNDGPDNRCWYASATELYDEDGQTGTYDASEDPQSEAAPAAEWAQALWELTHTRYDYAGWDDGSMQIRIALGQDKTQSRKSCGGVKFQYGWLVDDVLAHEWMHMIDHYTADLIYNHESGAIDEAFADIFGTFIDPGDWQLGEEINCSEPDACGCARRDLSDPPLCGSYADHIDDFLLGSWDNHRVHGNSSIINKAYYLMVNGGTHRGTTVSSVDRRQIEDLFWLTHVGIKQFGISILTKNSTFRQLANSLKFWAEQLSFTANERCQVINALHAVGLMAPDADCDGQPDQGPDTDGDSVDRQHDSCPNVSNPSQRDTDGDLVGDACDLDIDGDGIENTVDNCVYVANPSQAPGSPGGSIGLACLDTDRDRVFDHLDNCPDEKNTAQLDLDGDSIGDACDPDIDGDGVLNEVDPCPRDEGAGGLDQDGDGIADLCDNCPGDANPQQENSDFDRPGDACDWDLDGDGIPQGDGANPCQGPHDTNCDDNCPTLRNHDQTDGDGDGIGQRCDPNELLELSAQRNELLESNVLVELLAGNVARFEISSCRSDDCPDWLADDFWTRVSLNSSVPLDTRIVDESGFVVTQRATDASGDVELQFDVAPEYHYVSPALGILPHLGNAAEQPVQLKTYFLEIRLAAGVDQATVDAVILVESNFPPQ